MTQNDTPIRYILDTDTVTYQQRRNEVVLQKLAQLSSHDVATTIITMYEQLRGRLSQINKAKDNLAIEQAYQQLQKTQDYYCQVQVLPFDSNAIQLYRQLVNQKLRIGHQDLKIAAVTLRHKAILVTSNHRHFDLVPSLQIVDWNTP